MVAGFTPPLVGASAAITGSTSAVIVKIDSNVAVVFDPLYEKVLERIHIPTSKAWRPESVRGTTSHELFHAVQHQYYTMWGLSNLWWIESTAEYASQNIAWNPGNTEQTGISEKYLEKPLSSSEDKHEYSTVYFIKFLVEKKGINFKEMWDYVSKAEWWNFGDTVYPLSEYLKSKGFSGLNDIYAEFAEYFIFDPDSPMPANPKDEIPILAASKWNVMFLEEKSISNTFDLAGGYTGKLWGIKVKVKPEEQTRKLQVKSTSDLTGYTSVNVFLLKDDKRPGTRIGGLTKDNPSIKIEMGENDGLYILAVNTGSSNQEVKVTVEDADDTPIDISSDCIDTSGSCSFSANVQDLPKNLRFEWDFGDGNKMSSTVSSIDHKYAVTPSDKIIAFGVNVKVYDAATNRRVAYGYTDVFLCVWQFPCALY